MKKNEKTIKAGSPEWEEICENCGRCCYEKLDYRGQIIYTNQPCKHLNTKSNRCLIYDNRSELHPECARLTPELVAAGFLPEDCPYVANLDVYQAPQLKNK